MSFGFFSPSLVKQTMAMDFSPVVHTRRLTLRKLTLDDVESLLTYANHPAIADAIWNIPHPYQEPDKVYRIRFLQDELARKSGFVFAIVHRARQKLIGKVSLVRSPLHDVAQLGYWIGEPFWGNGFATEAVEAALTFGFHLLDLGMIYAECHVDNVAAHKVLAKNGMILNSVHGKLAHYRSNKGEYDGQGRARGTGDPEKREGDKQ